MQTLTGMVLNTLRRAGLRLVLVTVASVVLCVATAATSSAAVSVFVSGADRVALGQAMVPSADPSPSGSVSPTLGSTEPEGVDPQDDSDGDPDDYTQVGLAFLAPLALAVVVGGSASFYLIRRARRRRIDHSRAGTS